MAPGTAYTIGHGSRALDELCRELSGSGVKVLFDVRRWPRSRRNPQFNRENLERECPAWGIRYIHLPILGGYRKFGRDTRDLGLFRCFESEGFRAYATYLAIELAAARGLELVAYTLDLGVHVGIMCSEVTPWRCHRKIIADWLASRGYRVVHLLPGGRAEPHTGTRCIGEVLALLRGASHL